MAIARRLRLARSSAAPDRRSPGTEGRRQQHPAASPAARDMFRYGEAGVVKILLQA